MSDLIEILLADGQRLQERRTAPPPNTPATRADKIIAEGDRKRHAYRTLNPDADTAMVFAAQIGYLHTQVRILAAECDELTIRRDTNLQYDRVQCAALGGDVWVGYSFTPGEPAQPYGPPEACDEGSPDEFQLAEVWVNGREISAGVRSYLADEIEAAALACAKQRQAKAAEQDGEL